MTFYVTTPPAKAGGFLRRSPLQQQLLRLRLSYCSTLAPEGSIRAYWVTTLPGVSSLTCRTSRHSRELEVGKEHVTMPMTARLRISLAPKGDGRNSPVA